MATARRKLKKNTSFATWKFEIEDTVNADPQTDGACLQVLRAYLNFMGEPGDRPFVSISSLKVATAMHEGAIVRARRKLITLGYFIQVGYTSAGATRFQIVNSRLNLVLDHQIAARETLRRLEAEKKEKDRFKRKWAGSGPADIAGDKGPADIADLNPEKACGNRRDSPADIADESVYNSVESISMEEERISIGDTSSPSYSSSYAPDEANMPLPKPRDDDDADRMIDLICDGHAVNQPTRDVLARLLNAGILTPNMATNIIKPKKEADGEAA